MALRDFYGTALETIKMYGGGGGGGGVIKILEFKKHPRGKKIFPFAVSGKDGLKKKLP
ncbi:hypothetical protein AGMMS49573_09550 [Endomicrobiia bacterium]|nr:hypothetical protein AGMMS49573_09550 [Endomicrobiia bacterium]